MREIKHENEQICEIESLSHEIWNCTECKNLGVKRDPESGLVPLCFEGNPKSELWILGLNPKNMSAKELKSYPSENFKKYYDYHQKYSFEYSYFSKLQIILDKINDHTKKHFTFGENVLSTDIVKCASPNWDITNTGHKLSAKEKRTLVTNCIEWLWKQIKCHKPKYIICNGIKISQVVFNHYKDKNRPRFDSKKISMLNYDFVEDGHKFTIFLTGFINRSDNLSKIRFSYDIIEKLNKNK